MTAGFAGWRDEQECAIAKRPLSLSRTFTGPPLLHLRKTVTLRLRPAAELATHLRPTVVCISAFLCTIARSSDQCRVYEQPINCKISRLVKQSLKTKKQSTWSAVQTRKAGANSLLFVCVPQALKSAFGWRAAKLAGATDLDLQCGSPPPLVPPLPTPRHAPTFHMPPTLRSSGPHFTKRPVLTPPDVTIGSSCAPHPSFDTMQGTLKAHRHRRSSVSERGILCVDCRVLVPSFIPSV